MQEPNDHDLLRQFAEQNSETAFAALVTRHVDKVYSTALRHTRNAHAAEEITQAVFVILAKKSGRLGARVILAGWLYETARLTAVTYIRREIRRSRREQEAHMQTALNENADDAWSHIAPLLDDAMSKLSEADRHAIVLRYFDGKSLGEVGAALGASEDAAKKRVTRAVEKLRGWFTKRGVTLTATVLTAAISANSVQAAPLGLAATVTATVAKGTLISATLTALVNTTIKTMTWLKIKFAVGVSLAALLVGGAATVALSSSNADKTTDPVAEAILNKTFEKYASLSDYSDSGKSFTDFSTNTFSIKLGRPDRYRMEWDAVGTGTGFSGAAWSAGDGHFQFFTGPTWKNSQRYHRMKGLGEAFERSANISGGAAFTIPPVFFGKPVSEGSGLLGLCSNFIKHGDAKIGDIDCYVLTGHLKVSRDIPISLWIGKDDLLIHQIQRTTLDPDPNVTPPTNTPEFKKLLGEWSKAATPGEKAAIQNLIQIAGAKFSAKTRKAMVHTEIHENIVVNQSLVKEGFIFQVPAGLKPSE